MIAHVQSINLSTKVPPFRGTPKPRYSHARHLRRRPDPCAHRPGSHRRHHSPQPRLRKRPSNLLRPSGPPRLQPLSSWALHTPHPRIRHHHPYSLTLSIILSDVSLQNPRCRQLQATAATPAPRTMPSLQSL